MANPLAKWLQGFRALPQVAQALRLYRAQAWHAQGEPTLAMMSLASFATAPQGGAVVAPDAQGVDAASLLRRWARQAGYGPEVRIMQRRMALEEEVRKRAEEAQRRQKKKKAKKRRNR